MELYFDFALSSFPGLMIGRPILFFDAEQQPRATASSQPLWSQGDAINPAVCCLAKLGYSVGILNIIYIDRLIEMESRYVVQAGCELLGSSDLPALAT